MDARPDSGRAADPAPGRAAEPAPGPAPELLTDEQLGSIMRDVATGWTMPPRSLHDVTWQDRIRGSSGTRGGGARRGWARSFGARVAAAFSLAVAGVVLLALVAVWLRSPASPGLVGSSDSPVPSIASIGSASPAVPSGKEGATPSAPGVSPSGRSATPSAPVSSSVPTASPLTAGPIVGQPLPGRFVPVRGSDGYAPLDLGNGSLAQSVARGFGSGDNVVIRADGTLLCVCEGAVASGLPGDADPTFIMLREFRPDGSLVKETRLKVLVGNRGPNDPSVDFVTPLSVVSAALSSDDATLFVGWSVRQTDAWRSGVLVVDVGRAAVTQTVSLPDAAVAPHERRLAEAPQVALSPNGSQVLIRFRTVTDAAPPPYQRWNAPFSGGRIGALTELSAGAGTLFALDCSVPLDEGFATDDSYYALCLGDDFNLNRLVFRRVHLDGALIGDTSLRDLAPNGMSGAGFAVDRRAGLWYAWSPFGQRLARIALATGAIEALKTVERSTGSTGQDWLGSLGRAVGRWIAPSTAAKLEIQPSLAISPDGSRLYALAVAHDSPTEEPIAPGGVLVIDTGTLERLDVWAPTADYDSVAISGDGAWVYALGLPGVDAEGKESGTTQASLTVYRAEDGQVRLRATRLSSLPYEFPAATLP